MIIRSDRGQGFKHLFYYLCKWQEGYVHGARQLVDPSGALNAGSLKVLEAECITFGFQTMQTLARMSAFAEVHLCQ